LVYIFRKYYNKRKLDIGQLRISKLDFISGAIFLI
jgi:hypothetical protein